MSFAKRYKPEKVEGTLQRLWQEEEVYHFSGDASRPLFAIDTPPPTVSGHLHLGHVYSYGQADFIARYRRMRGDDVLYPMGYDDNGLPTERLVEETLGLRAQQIGRQAFIGKCLEVSEDAEKAYQALWQRLGLSVDWRFTYRTIDENSRRISQRSFLDLYQKGLAYRRKAPTIWCPECQTAIAQAELHDLERETEFVTLAFGMDDGSSLSIATTRPELLPACVAIFVHPEDERYHEVVGRWATVPHFRQEVQVLADAAADPETGTGAVMCCTFGDTSDVAWWHAHDLQLVEAIGRDGLLTRATGEFAGLSTVEARQKMKQALADGGHLLSRQSTNQSVRVHERCDTPVEYIVTWQWFVNVLAHKDTLLEAGKRVRWHPAHMENRYTQWVENLNWDWCISRQRFFGVPFPVWYCDRCGEVTAADLDSLPVDPGEEDPSQPCACGSTHFRPERDVMDTWATSSTTPQLVGQMMGAGGFDGQPFEPLALRPQAHEIIRTWAFYSIVKANYHFDALPWKEAAISGWGLAPHGMNKISKSRGGGPVSPIEMIERYSADAVRYWAASASLGKDAIISEEKIQAGSKLVNKLWNVARFSQRFLASYGLPGERPPLSLADRWILDSLQDHIIQVTRSYNYYDYAKAKSDVERFFWVELADNYLEMAKKRLYDGDKQASAGAHYALYHALLVTIKLLAPILPYVTEEIYRGLFAGTDGCSSIHHSQWPVARPDWADRSAAEYGQVLLLIATSVRRHKSDNGLSLGSALPELRLVTSDADLKQALKQSVDDIASVTRATIVTYGDHSDPAHLTIVNDGHLSIELRAAGASD